MLFSLIVVKTTKRDNDNKRITYLCSRKGLKNRLMQDWSKFIERPIVDDVFENDESYQETER